MRRGENPKQVIQELVSKQFDATFETPTSIPPEILAAIHERAGENIPEEQLLVRYAHLANDQYDRSYERFPVAVLQRFAETIGGKSLLPGHDRSELPIGAWLPGQVIRDAQGIHHLRAPFFMDGKSPEARKVRLGIAKPISISFKSGGRVCDLCDTLYDGDKGCENGHRKGQAYDGKLCQVTYAGDLSRYESMEGSLVWLGCQYGAEVKADDPYGGQVLAKSYREEAAMPDEILELKAKIAEQEDTIRDLQALANDGKAYREYLRSEIARKFTAPLVDQPDAAKSEAETILKTLETANIETLQAWDRMAQAKFDAAFPAGAQSKQMGNGAAPLPELGGPPPDRQPSFNPNASLRR